MVPASSADDGSRSDSGHCSRRRFLSTAAAGTVALAGCTETLPPLGQRVRLGRIDVPESAPPDYRQWVPDTEALPDEYAESPVNAVRPAVIAPQGIGYGVLTARSDWFGHRLDEYDYAVDIGGVTVLNGDTDRQTVAGVMADTAYEPVGTYEGYDRYERDDPHRVVAAGNGAVVQASGDRAFSGIETVIDAGAGRVDRRHEVDEPFATLTDAAGAAGFDIINGMALSLDATDGALIRSLSHAYREEALYARNRFLFETADEVPERRIRRELRASETAVDADAADVRSDGRFAVVDLRVEHSYEGESWRPPLVTWGAAHDANAERVTVRHEAGESVPVESVHVVVAGSEGDRSSDDGGVGVDGLDGDTVSPGDRLTVPVGSGDHTIRVVLEPNDRVRTLLFDYQIP